MPNRRGLTCMMALVILLLSFTLAGMGAVVVFRPGVFGLALNGDVTATGISLQRTLDSLNAYSGAILATAEYNATQGVHISGTNAALLAAAFNLDSTRTAQEFNSESTRAALENYENQVYQGATQMARDQIATQTADAIANAQQATQSALEFAATQAAFDRIATQVELDYQGTQAALNRQATAAMLGFATQAPPAQDVLTQTPPPTLTAVPLFTDGFAGGVQAGLWQFGAAADWRLNDEGILAATRTGSWLLTQLDQLGGYILDVELLPLLGRPLASDYFVLLNVPREPETPGGLALRLTYDGERLTAAGLYRIMRADMLDEFGLHDSISVMDAVRTVQLDLLPDDELNVRVERRGAALVVIVNGSLILDMMLDDVPPPGAVGLQVPVSTRVRAVTLTP